MYKKDVVSMVIPFFNTAKYIEECIDSILNQTYKELQVIFVNDGSTDNSEAILLSKKQEFIEQGIEFNYLKQQHKGLNAAINAGFKEIKGEYTMWFDSDDILVSNNVEKKLKVLNENTDYDCVMAALESFEDETGKVLNIVSGAFDGLGSDWENFLFGYKPSSAGLNLVKSEALFECLTDGGIDPNGTEQNFEIMLRIAEYKKIKWIDDVLYRYRVRKNSDSHTENVFDGRRWKLFCIQYDYIKLARIKDAHFLSKEYINWVTQLYLLQSVTRRLSLLQKDLLESENDKRYVLTVIQDFFHRGYIEKLKKNRRLVINNPEGKYDELITVLNLVLEQDILPIDIEKEKVEDAFLIVLEGYNLEIERRLESLNLLDGYDYFYPQAEIYKEIKKHRELIT